MQHTESTQTPAECEPATYAVDVGSPHPWFEGKFLRIRVSKATGRVRALSWHVRDKDGNDDATPKAFGVRSPAEVHIDDLVSAFCLFGLGPSDLVVRGADLNEAYALIESIALPSNVTAVRKIYCECDLNRCHMARDYSIIGAGASPTTYGDVFAAYGDRQSTPLLVRGYYYEHPDSVFFHGKLFPVDEHLICPNREPNKEPVEFVFDPSRTYALFGYSR
ncbi:hypothetical protein pmac_cds_694 [Pandoravirus macleodensis]|uniref:Uncharacterized protein n=1 Tax=Pandoravirus macleodensis TaxID=2107707 RepID=A0A2U7UG22_9VIRU|nr:hypothetical protein pmac_cds_694 [Pandoravirus macleodensis]AVK77382.1 hypothetical protein pmac_cds_694 [Pandoravirus macleodensis]